MTDKYTLWNDGHGWLMVRPGSSDAEFVAREHYGAHEVLTDFVRTVAREAGVPKDSVLVKINDYGYEAVIVK